MTMTGRERFRAACRREAVDRPPVWMMRQAGRYLPEYREVRTRHTFLEMCKTPELAAEVTLQPIRRFGMDAAVIFSDILVVPEAMGISVRYEEGGPRLSPAIQDENALSQLRTPETARDLRFTCDAIALVRRQLADGTAILGFAGAPYTLATYMVEGGSGRELQGIKRLQYSNPALLHRLLERLAATTAEFLLAQIEAGADAVQIFDTWAGNLTPRDYAEFAIPYVRTVVQRVKPAGVPVILYVNGIAGVLEIAATSGADVISIDWRVDLRAARDRIGDGIGLQGNLDPVLLFADPQKIRAEVRRLHESLGVRTGHVFNLGHGILQHTPIEGAAAFIRAVQEL